MKIVLVTGMPEIDRSVLIEIALKRLNYPKEKLDSIDLDESSPILQSIMEGNDLTIKQIGQMIKQMNDEYQKTLIRKMKEVEGVLIVNCSLTINTENGIFPILKRDFFETFSPEVIILAESVPNESTNKGKEMKLIDKIQDINEVYAFSYSSFSHAAVDRIIMKRGKMDDGAKHLTATIRSVVSG